MLGTLHQVQSGGESRRAAAEDENLIFHPGIVLPHEKLVKSGSEFWIKMV
jgi:hypothetical protein